MIRINLIAGEREKPKRRSVGFDIGQKVTLVCSLILVATALGIGWWWWALDREQAHLTTETAEAERETARLKTILAQVTTFDKQKRQLGDRVKLIEELRKGQSGAVHMVDELSKTVPDMLWLTDLEQKGTGITIQGQSTTLISLSDFVGNLGGTSLLEKPIEIVDSKVETVTGSGPGSGVDLIKFTVKAQLAPSAKAASPAPIPGGAR